MILLFKQKFLRRSCVDTSKIGNKIKTKRQQLNMTQKDLAKAMNISNQLVSKWETGESVPSLDYLDMLCQVLKVDITYFISNKPAKQKNKHPQVTKIVALVIALFIGVVGLTFECLVINFTIIPATCKTRYLDNIEESINKTLSLGYYNIELVGKLDNDEKFHEYKQGYIDDDGSPVCYNSEDSNNDISNIHTLEELFDNQFSFEDSDTSLEFDDLKYIRKTSYGYYMEMKESVWRDELTNTQKKNYKLTHKITCKVKIKKGYFQSMEMTVKYLDKPSNEHFTITSTITFKQTKPDPLKENPANSIWKMIIPETDEANFINQMSPSSTTLSLDEDTKNLLNKYSLYQSNGYIYTLNRDSDTVNILDPNTLATTKTIKATNLFYYSPTSTSNSVPMIYIYNNNFYYLQKSTDKYSYATSIVKINLETNEKTSNGPITLSGSYYRTLNFKGKYLICSEHDALNKYPRSYVYDLESETYLYKTTDINIICVFVDSANQVYCRDYSKEDNIKHLYLQNTNKKVLGYSVVGEHDGYVYTKDYNGNYFKYHNNQLVEALDCLPNEMLDDYTIINNDYSHNYTNKVYYNNSYNYRLIKNVNINGTELKNAKILGCFNNQLLVCYNHSSFKNKIEFSNLACYNLSDLSKPKCVAETKSMYAYSTSHGTILAVKQIDDSYNYYFIK